MRDAVAGLAPTRPARSIQAQELGLARAGRERTADDVLLAGRDPPHVVPEGVVPRVVAARRRQRVEQHQAVAALREADHEAPGHAEHVPREDRRPVEPRGVDHRRKVVAPLVDERARPVGDRVREPDAAPVEDRQPPDRAQAVEQAGTDRVVGQELDREVEPRHHHQVVVGGPVEHAVGDVGVVALRVLHVAHGRRPLLGRSQRTHTSSRSAAASTSTV